MYVLDMLNGWNSVKLDDNRASFEYRLLCSGALYNSTIRTSDWRKSDATRPLVRSPFTLDVCSHPFEEYPQELCLRFDAPIVTKTRGDFRSIFFRMSKLHTILPPFFRYFFDDLSRWQPKLARFIYNARTGNPILRIGPSVSRIMLRGFIGIASHSPSPMASRGL